MPDPDQPHPNVESGEQVSIPNIAMVVEARPSGIQASHTQPPAKKRRLEGAYNIEDDGKKTYDIACRDSKSFKGKFNRRAGDS